MVRQHCHGQVPLDARIEPWMLECMDDMRLFDRIAEFGSPLNVIHTGSMEQNVAALRQVASDRKIDFKIFFARKSNKCLSFVDQAKRSGIGIDTASENEVQQCLSRGIDPDQLICTAAVKSEALLQLCLERQICIVVDNSDELNRIVSIAKRTEHTAPVALRLGGFHHQGQKLPTRFGFDVERDRELSAHLGDLPISVLGVHFHLGGYDAGHRVAALIESLDWINRLRREGHSPAFVDMGGGFPMSYLQSETQWKKFWDAHQSALLGQRREVTYRNHGLGLTVHQGEIIGKPNSYPYYQSPTKGDWLRSILDFPVAGVSIAKRIASSNVQLRCEPGRSLMDGCGMTVAGVEFRKQNAEGHWLIGLSMNRTQCRTSSDDFLVDPILLPCGRHDRQMKSGFLVGAYCTESELLSLRHLVFPHGVRCGDLVVFPNTAGYLMHFLESRSHQFPLAKNYVWQSDSLDPIDHQRICASTV
ncbi:Diaminopimelate decarboxylase [Stieleria maiorica]|uniref:Diaminopimelate decarboxylase n=2 Tax=Stieleria maiorica TaxID=2795974 RepID=A0A5B9MHU9_9BACT|nr:Diaminopimelate decarboxylase [Stieleria maiorica]